MFEHFPDGAVVTDDPWSSEVFARAVGDVPSAESGRGDPLLDWPDDPDGSDLPPPDLTAADCLPSGWLALELDTGTVDDSALSDASLIDAIVGFDRIAAWAMARQARLLGALTHRRPADPVPGQDQASVCSRFAPDEVAVALHLARGTASARLAVARRLLDVLPATHASWEAGRIDTSKATAIHDATLMVPPDKAVTVQDRVLPRAPQQSLPQLRAALARAVLAVDPDGAADRHRAARADRRVSVRDEADGMGSLWALLAASDAAGAYEWLTRLARGLGPDDPRSMDARRADLLAALLTGQLVVTDEITDHEPDGTEPDGTEPDGTEPDGTEPDGTEPEASRTEDSRTEDSRTEASRTEASRTEDSRTEDSRTEDSRTEASETEDSGTRGSGTHEVEATDGADAVGDPNEAREVSATPGSPNPGSDGSPGSDGVGAAGDRRVPAAGGRPVPLRPVAPGRPLIQIVIPYSTLTGADDQPAELVGHGPIPAGLAREIAADDAVWHRLLTDPASGTLLDYGRTTYHPPAALADHVRARDQHCRFPHCRRRAATAELDHTIAWADGGDTSAANLHTVCPHHHRLKHHAGWRVHAHPDGSLTWTTPTGHQHTTTPHDHRPHPPPPAGPPTTVSPPAVPPPVPVVSAQSAPRPDPPPF